LWAISEPEQHLALRVEDIVRASGGRAQVGPTLARALGEIAAQAVAAGQTRGRVLICGSLYLAGVALRQDGWRAS
jgi:dihydrofolate synthase/folylpolyglutamate synthase